MFGKICLVIVIGTFTLQIRTWQILTGLRSQTSSAVISVSQPEFSNEPNTARVTAHILLWRSAGRAA